MWDSGYAHIVVNEMANTLKHRASAADGCTVVQPFYSNLPDTGENMSTLCRTTCLLKNSVTMNHRHDVAHSLGKRPKKSKTTELQPSLTFGRLLLE